MPKPLVFMMGRSPAFLPVDRLYARNHMWAEAVEGGHRFGLSAYAVRLLGEVQHLQWSIAPGCEVACGRPIGTIEASKAASDLYAPITGRLEALNPEILGRPRLINSNLYDTGWLLTIAGPADSLLTPEQYLAHLEASWPLAQRLLKGQV
jgi:glycine cleavage system H protein